MNSYEINDSSQLKKNKTTIFNKSYIIKKQEKYITTLILNNVNKFKYLSLNILIISQ